MADPHALMREALRRAGQSTLILETQEMWQTLLEPPTVAPSDPPHPPGSDSLEAAKRQLAGAIIELDERLTLCEHVM